MRKKIIIVCAMIMLLPSNIFACPHIDSTGKPHLQTYNEDYTEMTMIYPMDKHLYIKEVVMSIENSQTIAHEDELLKEIFSFPVVQNMESYYTYYWFLNNNLSEQQFDSVDVETTIKSLNNMEISSENYKMTVNFTNTYSEGIKLENDLTQEIYYDVIIDKKTESEKHLKFISDNNLNMVSSEILDTKIRYNMIETDGYNYENLFQDIIVLKDNITLQIKSAEVANDVVAINLMEDITSENLLEVEITDDGYYSFLITEPGTYVVIEKPSEDVIIKADNLESNITTKDILNIAEEESNMIYYIVGGSVILILVIATYIVIKRKRK